jgi:hypothetical protein
MVSMQTMIFPAYMLGVVISAAAGRGTGLLVLYLIPLTMSGFFRYCLAVTRTRYVLNICFSFSNIASFTFVLT